MSRLKAMVQHFHGRLRVDENFYLTQSSKFAIVRDTKERLLSYEKKSYQSFYKTIEKDYEEFRKNLYSRGLEKPLISPEFIGEYLYYSVDSPVFSTYRRVLSSVLSTQDGSIGEDNEIFSVSEIASFHKIPKQKLSSLQTPIIRLNDNHSKLLYIVDTQGNDRPTLGVKDLTTNKFTVLST